MKLEEKDLQRLEQELENSFNSAERSHKQDAWALLSKYVLNKKHFISSDILKKTYHKNELMSTKAVVANQTLADILYSLSVSASNDWLDVSFDNKEWNNSKQKKIQLDKLVQLFYSQLNSDKFHPQIIEVYKLFTGLGSACLYIGDKRQLGEVGFQGFKFDAMNIGTLAWQENGNHEIDTLYRKFELTARELVSLFPNVKNENVLKSAEDGIVDTKFLVYNIVRPRELGVKLEEESELLKPEDRPFLDIMILKDGLEVLHEDGHYEFPFVIPRCSVSAEELYGTSRGEIGLPAIIGLDRLKWLELKAVELSILPPILTTDKNLIQNFELVPRKIITVSELESLAPFQLPDNIRLKDLEIEKLEMDIEKLYFLDKLVLPPRTETGEQSIFELELRVKQSQEVLGSVIVQIREMMSKIAQITFAILLRGLKQQKIGDPDIDSLITSIKESKVNIELNFVGPLAKNQQINALTKLRSFVQDHLVYKNAFPTILDKIDQDKISEIEAEIYSINPEVLREDKKVQEIRDKRAKAQQEERRIESENKQADTQSKKNSTGSNIL